MFISKFLKQHCLICGSAGLGDERVCDLCRMHLQFVNDYPHCLRCGELLLARATSQVCGHCVQNPPHFQETHVCFVYEELIAYLIQGLKFSRRLQVVPFLVQEMSHVLQQAYQGRKWPDLILPVPLQRSRQFKRGFNQVHEIARRVAKNVQVEYCPYTLSKIKATRAQAQLNRQERVRNLKGSFRLRTPLKIQSVALVDDVMTTGSTLRELSGVLHQHGVEEVHVWAVARARL